MEESQLTTLYHAATMGDWAGLVREQATTLAAAGLRDVLCTHVGPDREAFQYVCRANGLRLTILKSDPNIAHYETFAMLALEQLARHNDGAFLYLHTKGVSVPQSDLHRRWRALMTREVVVDWRVNLAAMDGADVAGVGWGYNFSRPHFPGNFWMARADWLRRLPDFTAYHHQWQLQRFSCEAWIGATPGPRVHTRLCRDLPWHEIVQRFFP